MARRMAIWSVVVGLLAGAAPLAAQILKYVDAQGVTHYVQSVDQIPPEYRAGAEAPKGLPTGREQEIVLVSVAKVRLSPGELWLVGKGYARVNGGSAAYFWESSTPPQLEIKISSTDPSLGRCETLVEQGVPTGKVLSIRGGGAFNGRDVAQGIFELDSLSSCDVYDRPPRK